MSVRKEKQKDICTIILWNTLVPIEEIKGEVYIRAWKNTCAD